LVELQCAIRDAAMIVARLSLDPSDGYIGPRVILSKIRPTTLATRSVRPENITISGINFALSNLVIRKTLQRVYNLKFERSQHNEDQFTHNDKKYYVYKVGVDISDRHLPGVRTPEEAAFLIHVEERISNDLDKSNAKKGEKLPILQADHLPPPYDPSVKWTGDDSQYPFPHMTSDEYMMKIEETFHADSEAMKAMCASYGLDNPAVNSDIEKIADGGIAKLMAGNGFEKGARLKTFWALVQEFIPYLVTCLNLNTNLVSLVTTLLECSFSILNNVLCPNDAVSSTSSALSYMMNTHKDIQDGLKAKLENEHDKRVSEQLEKIRVGELDPDHLEEIRGVPRRPLRSMAMRHAQANEVIIYTQLIREETFIYITSFIIIYEIDTVKR
jgi:hypothetical protein